MSVPEIFGWIAIIAGWSVIPVIAIHYFAFGVRTRKQQLRELFSRPDVIKRYLARRRSLPNAESEADRLRLQQEFDAVFDEQFENEYGFVTYLVPSTLATLLSGLVITLLVSQGLGGPIGTVNLPQTVIYALLGALFWTVWTLTRAYETTDLTPGTFYWIACRYVLCVPIGLLGKQVFADNIANLGVFVISTLPVDEILELLRKKVPGLAAEEGGPPLDKLQGLDANAMARLQDRDIGTTQQLAYTDPLQLLFHTNIDTSTLADLMDQAFLYNYIGDKVEKLRGRGIRGAIEMASLKDTNDTKLLETIASLLEISTGELKYFVSMLYDDSQMRLIWHLAFSSDTERSKKHDTATETATATETPGQTATPRPTSTSEPLEVT